MTDSCSTDNKDPVRTISESPDIWKVPRRFKSGRDTKQVLEAEGFTILEREVHYYICSPPWTKWKRESGPWTGQDGAQKIFGIRYVNAAGKRRFAELEIDGIPYLLSLRSPKKYYSWRFE